MNNTIPENLTRHRQRFSSLAGKRYFNYGGQGPMADSAIAALAYGQQSIQSKGPFSAEVYEWIVEEARLIREAIAHALGSTPDTITLTENVTVGCNIPLWVLPWQQVVHTLMGDCAPSGVAAADREMCRRHGATGRTGPAADWRPGADPIGMTSKGLR